MGGTTMVVDMVVPAKEESLTQAYDKWRRWADDKVRRHNIKGERHLLKTELQQNLSLFLIWNMCGL